MSLVYVQKYVNSVDADIYRKSTYICCIFMQTCTNSFFVILQMVLAQSILYDRWPLYSDDIKMYGTLLIEQCLLLPGRISSSVGISFNCYVTWDFTVPLFSDNRSPVVCMYGVKSAVVVTVSWRARDIGHGESTG
jgi:hypothetical protein